MICTQFLPTGSYPTIISCDFQPSLYRCQNHPSDCLGAAPGPHATDEHFWFRQWRLKAVLKLHHHQHKPRELLWKHIKIDYIFGNYIKIFKHIYINHLCIYIYIYLFIERERDLEVNPNDSGPFRKEGGPLLLGSLLFHFPTWFQVSFEIKETWINECLC